MNAALRPASIVGARARGFRWTPPKGTRTLNCQLCEEPTLFAPSSLKRPEAAYAMFVCLPCALEGAETFEIAPPTAEQLRELEESLAAGEI